MDESDIRVTDLMQSFLTHQEDPNHSPRTVRWHSDMLGRFPESLGPEGRLRDIDTEAIRGFQRRVRETDLT